MPEQFTDDGFIAVQIGDKPAVTLDLVRCNNQIAGVQRLWRENPQFKQPPATELDDIVELMASWGLERPSHKLAIKIQNRITSVCDEQLGKDGPAQNPSPSPA